MLCSIEEKRIYQIIFQAVPLAALGALRSGFRSRSSLLTSLRWPLRALHIANSSKIVSASYRTRTAPSSRGLPVRSFRASSFTVACIHARFSPVGALTPLNSSSLNVPFKMKKDT